MSGYDRLVQNLPSSYAKGPGTENEAWLVAVGSVLDDLTAAVDDFRGDTFLETGDGAGLSRAAENYTVTRPPGMTDDQFRVLAQKIASMNRVTLFAIKDVFEAASGYTGVTVEDYQIYTGTRPALFTVRITIPEDQVNSVGRGFYPGLTPTNTDGYPVESAIGGIVIDEQGFYGGLFNDHVYSLVDHWTLAIMDRIRAAGIVYEFVLGPASVATVNSLSDYTGRVVKITPSSSPFQIGDPYQIILVDTSAGAVELTLPPTSVSAGKLYKIKDCGGVASVSNITIKRSSPTETIDNVAADWILNIDLSAVQFVCSGTNWHVTRSL